jgi:GntR family transcriptional regulator, transcriptional repressor for pyruvate dehydrogenase complex
MPLTRVDRTSAYDSVRDQLVGLIRGGEYRVGDKLPPELDLALVLGVSRSVVREALGSLKALGLVQSETGRGTFVVSTTPSLAIQANSVEECHQALRFLETPAAGVTARHRSESSLEELESILDALDNCHDSVEWTRLDTAFHVGLARASGNRVVADLIEHMRDSIREQLLALAEAPPTRMAESNVEHRRIYQAVVEGNESAASKAMERHLKVTREILASMMIIDTSSTAPLAGVCSGTGGIGGVAHPSARNGQKKRSIAG